MSQSNAVFGLQAELCLAMSSPVRLRIIHLLKEGPQRVSNIVTILGIPQASISRHLAVLRNAGIVLANRHGSELIYQIANPKIIAVCDMMYEMLTEREEIRSVMLDKLRE